MDMLVLMKSIRNGCINGGNKLSDGPSTNGDPERTPGTELMGENLDIGAALDRPEEGEQIWNITNISLEIEEEKKEEGWPHITEDHYNYSPGDFLWEGWMWVGKVPMTIDAYVPP